MELFILRHGKAEAYRGNDAGRQLVTQGREEVARVIQSSLHDLQQVAQIWASPLIRAQQTADIAAAVLNIQPTTRAILTPEAEPEQVLRELQAVKCAALLLVSHQPLVSRLVERACGAAPGAHPMDTAALACIDFEIPGRNLGTLRWLRHPVA